MDCGPVPKVHRELFTSNLLLGQTLMGPILQTQNKMSINLGDLSKLVPLY